MYSMHPVIALDLARDRSRALDVEIERRRLASTDSGAAPAGAATAGASPAGASPAGAPNRRSGVRRAAATALRALSSGAEHLAGSAGRAACRLESGPA